MPSREQKVSTRREERLLERMTTSIPAASSPDSQSVSVRSGSLTDRGAGLHFLLRLNTEEDDEALRRRAEGLGVRLGFLSEYAAVPNPAYAHTLVVNYAGLDAGRLDEAEALLSEVFLTR